MPFHNHRCFAPFVFFDVVGREKRVGNSICNEREIAFVLELLEQLIRIANPADLSACSIAVITPYRTQVKLMKQQLEAVSLSLKPRIEINTVDGFQGREKDIVIISCVRASNSRSIGFLQDARRMNVAITRARSCLWICGCARALR